MAISEYWQRVDGGEWAMDIEIASQLNEAVLDGLTPREALAEREAMMVERKMVSREVYDPSNPQDWDWVEGDWMDYEWHR